MREVKCTFAACDSFILGLQSALAGQHSDLPMLHRRSVNCGGAGPRGPDAMTKGYATLGSLKASISPSNALIGTQLQNTFLSP